MKKIKIVFVSLLILVTFVNLSACASHNASQDPFLRTVKITIPLEEPIYGDASIAPFSVANPLNNLKKMDVFIFKGKIKKIEEVDIYYKHGTTAEGQVLMIDQWLSVCDVKIENILYGEIPGISDTIKVVSGQSTRLLASDEFRLLEGQEYYFITYVFNKKEPVNIETDPIRIIEFGNAMAGTYYDLFPINDGVVSFQGWTFEGAKLPAGITEGISAIDEESFLQQFVAMLNDVKSKQESVTDSPAETTALPSEPAAVQWREGAKA